MQTIVISTVLFIIIIICILYITMVDNSALRRLLNLKTTNAVQGDNATYVKDSLQKALVPVHEAQSSEDQQYRILQEIFETTHNASKEQKKQLLDNAKQRMVTEHNATKKLESIQNNLVLEEQLRRQHDKEIVSLAKNDTTQRMYFVDDMVDNINNFETKTRAVKQDIDQRLHSNMMAYSNYVASSMNKFSTMYNSQFATFRKAFATDSNAYNNWMNNISGAIGQSASNANGILDDRYNTVMNNLSMNNFDNYHQVEYSNYVVEHDIWKDDAKHWINTTRANMSNMSFSNSENLRNTSQLHASYCNNIKNFTYRDNVLSNQLLSIQNNIDMQKKALELALLTEDDSVTRKIASFSNDMYTNTSISTRMMTIGPASITTDNNTLVFNTPSSTFTVMNGDQRPLLNITTNNEVVTSRSNVMSSLKTDNLGVNSNLILSECLKASAGSLCTSNNLMTLDHILYVGPAGVQLGAFEVKESDNTMKLSAGVRTDRISAHNIQGNNSSRVNMTMVNTDLLFTNTYQACNYTGLEANTARVSLGNSIHGATMSINAPIATDWQAKVSNIASIAHGQGQGFKVNNAPLDIATPTNNVRVDVNTKQVNVKSQSQVCVNDMCFTKGAVNKLMDKTHNCVIVYKEPAYNGAFKVYQKGQYMSKSALNADGFGGGLIKSIWVGKNVKLLIFTDRNRNNNYQNNIETIQTFTQNQHNVTVNIQELEVIGLNESLPILDCQVGNWSSWSQCSQVCGGGKQTRTRPVTQRPFNGGKACPQLQEERSCCNTCGNWSEWSACPSCGATEQTRSRQVTADFSDSYCPTASQIERRSCPDANRQPCNNQDNIFYIGCYANESAFPNRVYFGDENAANFNSGINIARQRGHKYVAFARTGWLGYGFTFNDPPSGALSYASQCKLPCNDNGGRWCGCGDTLGGCPGGRQWAVYYIGNAYDKITAPFLRQNYCVDVSEISHSAGARVYMWGCWGGQNQEWKYDPATKAIKVKHSGQCLDVSGWGTGDLTPLQQYPCHGGENQQFDLNGVGNGMVEIRPRHVRDKCLDVYGGQTHDGAQLIQYQCHGGANQRFRFER